MWGVEAWMRCVPLALNTQARGCLACTRAHPSLPTSAWHQVLLHSPQSVSQHRHCQPHCPVNTHACTHAHRHTHIHIQGHQARPSSSFPCFHRDCRFHAEGAGSPPGLQTQSYYFSFREDVWGWDGVMSLVKGQLPFKSSSPLRQGQV